MVKCKSTTLKGEGCRNSHLPFSRYCWRHQDISAWVLGTVIGVVIGALVNIAVVLYQDRAPFLEVSFNPGEEGTPCILISTITNTGRAEARDVLLSFNNMLPLETKVFASPELGLTIIESESPPDPQNYPEEAKFQKAFAVRIPRIVPKDTITFQVVTSNSDNQRAGRQMLRIREDEIKVLLAFIDRVSKTYPNEVKKWNKNAVLNALIKNESFFTPAHLSYENGRIAVSPLNDAEQLGNAVNQDLYAKYKKEFIDVFQGGAKFKAPVVRIKTPQGESTYALFPPYASTYIDMAVPVEQLQESGGKLNVSVPVPREY